MKPASCFRDLASFSNRQKRLQQNRRYAVEIHNGTILERVSWLSHSPSRKLNRISVRTSAQQWIVRRGNSVRQHEGIEIDVARWTGSDFLRNCRRKGMLSTNLQRSQRCAVDPTGNRYFID